MDISPLNGFLSQVQHTAEQVTAIGLVLAPLIGMIARPLLAEAKRRKILRVTKASYRIVAELAQRMPGLTAAEGLKRLLALVGDEIGHDLSDDERAQVTRLGAAMHADPAMNGKLGQGIADDLMPVRK